MANRRQKVFRGIAAAAVACTFLLFTDVLFGAESVAPAREEIPFRQQNNPPAGSIARVLVVTVLTFGGVAAAGIVLRRNLQKKGLLSMADGKRIVVADKRRLSPKLTVFLLDVDDKQYLMVQSGDHIQIRRHKADPEKKPNNC